jgi:protoporphyrinogen oxidase
MGERVCVLGAGPAGLAAAWTLCNAGVPVTVIERGSQPGGLCATVEREGYRFDLGGHRIISKDHDLVHRIRTLMGDQLLERERRSAILVDGRRVAYPLEAGDLWHTMPRRYLARAAAGYGLEAAKRSLRPTPVFSFEDWVVARFGRPLYDTFFGPYTHKLWGIHPSELSADWAAQRISLMNLSDVALRLTGLRKGGARTYARRYLYPKQGIGQLFETLVDHLTARGVRFVLNTEAVGMLRRRDRVQSVALRGTSGKRRWMRASAVISTIPLGAVAQMIDPDVASFSKRLRFRGLRFCNVALRGQAGIGATWLYVASPKHALTRIQEPRQRSPHMAPRGCTSLMLEVPCTPGDPTWQASEATFWARVNHDLRDLGFDLRERVKWTFSVKAPDAYPIYHLGYRADRQRLLRVVDQVPNLHTIGRQGLFRYIFMDTAMEMGTQAAQDVLADRPMHSGTLMGLDQDNRLLEINATTA